MKKILLATTALIAAGLITSPARADKASDSYVAQPAGPSGVKLGLGGSYDAGFGLVSSDVATSREVGIKQDVEVYLTGETTFDNGLTVGSRLELDVGNSTADVTEDEKILYMSGSFGEFRIGNEDDARRLMSVQAPEPTDAVSVGDGDLNFKDITATSVTLPALLDTASGASPAILGSMENNTAAELESDTAKLIYFTPSFNGFTFGVSYAPDLSDLSETESTLGVTTDDGDELSLAGQYESEFNGVGLLIGAGYTTVDEASAGATAADHESYHLGANITVDAFTFGGSYGNVSAIQGTKNADADIFDLGATYGMGPWVLGVSYSSGEYDSSASTNGDVELDTYQVSGTYALATGVSLIGAIQKNKLNDTSATDKDSTAFVVGTSVNF